MKRVAESGNVGPAAGLLPGRSEGQRSAAQFLPMVTAILAAAFTTLALAAGGAGASSASVSGGTGLATGPATDTFAQPAEPARYNLSSVYGANRLQAGPGRTVRAELAFYNADGNRSAAVSFQIAAPQGWQVQVAWPGRSTAGTLTVSPTPVTDAPPAVAEGTTSVYLPNRGYVSARVAEVIITVPERPAEPAGEVTITAAAAYPGQDGAAGIALAQEFRLHVQVAAAR